MKHLADNLPPSPYTIDWGKTGEGHRILAADGADVLAGMGGARLSVYPEVAAAITALPLLLNAAERAEEAAKEMLRHLQEINADFRTMTVYRTLHEDLQRAIAKAQPQALST